jgi:septal ring factor EnvC (AmiA/AmiB activator)
MIKILYFLFSFFLANAKDTTPTLEKEINQNLESAARLGLEKSQLEEKIADLEKKIHDRKIILLKRSSALSYLKDYQFGALIARSESPSQLDRQLKIFERLNEYDLSLFKDHLASIKLLSVSKKNLETTIKNIAANVEKLKAQQQLLADQENERLQEVNKGNLASLIKFKGKLARPLEGSVIWPFGAKLDDAKQFVFVSKGLLFKTNPGVSVKSVGPGKIIFSDVLQHWRETLIIQHDDNYYSVYTGLKDSPLKVNDSVELNQIIGNAGSDEFYFELRHFDNPINPKSWFKESL